MRMITVRITKVFVEALSDVSSFQSITAVRNKTAAPVD
jgi:hypothetical protein